MTTPCTVKCDQLPPALLPHLAAKITQRWPQLYHPPLAEVALAAALASRGHLGTVRRLRLVNLSLSSIPALELASLARCVRGVDYHLDMDGVTGDLAPLLANINCTSLSVRNMRLSTADTRALVAAMTSRVQEVVLGGSRGWGCGGVSLDMEALARYDGRGVCSRLQLGGATRERYGHQVEEWAASRGWTRGGGGCCVSYGRI